MIKKTLITFAIVVTFLASIILVPTTSYAQSTTTDTGTYNSNSTSNTDTGAGTTTDNTGGFNWWWLLPLLAIPVFFVLVSRGHDDLEDKYYTDQRSFAGAKGGRARKKAEDTDEEDVDE